MRTPKISVIVPVYNAGQYLRPCLDSLINQIFTDFETILIVDCPTDGSDKVCAEYASHDERFHVFYNETNLHIGNSRNRGLQEAKGDYIAFLDHDDLITPNALQELYDLALNTSAEVVLSNKEAHACLSKQQTNSVVDARAILKDLIGGGKIYELDSSYNLVLGNLYKTDVAKQIRFVDTRYISAEDRLYNIEFMINASVAALLSDNLYSHIKHNSNEGDKWSYLNYKKRGKAMEYMDKLVREYDDERLLPYLYDGLNKQALRLLAGTIPFHWCYFFKTRRYLQQTLCFKEAYLHYRIPAKRKWYKKCVRRFLVWIIS